ncbi:IS110 family transposase [Lysinibacillus sp. 2017]|uniref:IS110 family transposase n=1 Tax=unclassified Lysinibacillus TaxID=2636778 RepID=UPI000D526939|nr:MULTISPECIES: IS110 family transposase [unclassified Lysinibacillus]AWE07302.1 IS110 family transposase [Lysinibacillus sp. 2017]AWE07766.1 IS110 family transposase [Lysinibacillus sp. 2017]AWE07966.1 IS110 family transposase [Lysinibacillus sp. 2017]TGN29907.1 IS110 family transposase [Lysinibacillus sp. S2017]
MNFNTNEKINQVSENTLVIGIDIAKHKHFACAIDDRGRVLQKSFPILQSRVGFEGFYERLLTLKVAHEKQGILVGFEPTGHYWMNLAAFLTNYGIPFVMVNPMHVNRSKELDDNLQTKNDQKDALVIARLMRDGRFSYPRLLEGVEAELRNGATLRSKIQEDLNALRNRLIRWLDRFFPEFPQVFKKFGKMAYAALEMTPLPSDIKGKSPDELLFLYRQVEGMKSPQLPKAKQLVEAAQNSIGLTEGLVMAKYEIATLLSQIKLMQAQLDELTVQLTELAKQMTDYDYLASIPGIGDVTVVDLLSEVGSLTQYEHPRQLIKLAGLTLRENSSGKQKGQKRISKRGRRKLRALLFRVMMPLIRHNQAFKQLHEYYTTRTVNPLRKKQSIVVLCGKLLKILHALCKKKTMFNVQQMMNDFASLQAAA